jgi:hypothetical protein
LRKITCSALSRSKRRAVATDRLNLSNSAADIEGCVVSSADRSAAPPAVRGRSNGVADSASIVVA